MARAAGSGGNNRVFTEARYSLDPAVQARAENSWLIDNSQAGLFDTVDMSDQATRDFFELESPYEQGISAREKERRVQTIKNAGYDVEESVYVAQYYRRGQASGSQKGAALTDIPTSTTDAARPRTVAAGWDANPGDPEKGTLTVVFRDGTIYNFYDVEESVWIGFHNSISKGRGYLNPKNSKQASDGKLLVGYRHEEANVNGLSAAMREMVYRAARTAQFQNRTKFRYYYRDAQGTRKSRTVTGVRNRDLGRSNQLTGKNTNTAASKPNTSAKGPRRTK